MHAPSVSISASTGGLRHVQQQRNLVPDPDEAFGMPLRTLITNQAGSLLSREQRIVFRRLFAQHSEMRKIQEEHLRDPTNVNVENVAEAIMSLHGEAESASSSWSLKMRNHLRHFFGQLRIDPVIITKIERYISSKKRKASAARANEVKWKKPQDVERNRQAARKHMETYRRRIRLGENAKPIPLPGISDRVANFDPNQLDVELTCHENSFTNEWAFQRAAITVLRAKGHTESEIIIIWETRKKRLQLTRDRKKTERRMERERSIVDHLPFSKWHRAERQIKTLKKTVSHPRYSDWESHPKVPSVDFLERPDLFDIENV